MPSQLSFFEANVTRPIDSDEGLRAALERFEWNGRPTEVFTTEVTTPSGPLSLPTLVNEFWTSRQRAAHSLHEISYRACFKPQLPRFFIERLTAPGQVVYDPFMGRGTTLLEAALLERAPAGCDVNPLSVALIQPRLMPPSYRDVSDRLRAIDWSRSPDGRREDLEVFFHPDTLRQIRALRAYLLARKASGQIDEVDRWIQMVAVNRLTGHSSGFFSVYTLPPNQALSVDSQRRINKRLEQQPSPRDVGRIVLTKTRSLLRDSDEHGRLRLRRSGSTARLLTRAADATAEIETESIDLVVTSPPFLDVVDYAGDNWLRCWFCGVDPSDVPITVIKSVSEWQHAMTTVFAELRRVLKTTGWIAFEVGEVRGGSVQLEEPVVRAASAAGLDAVLILINSQRFTKTAACWGVSNNTKGTNTNRIVVLRKRRP